MKARISTEWLSGCSGCHVAVVDLHEKLLGLMDEVEFVRVPVLMDERGYPPADVGLVEGAVRSEHDRHALLKLRESVKTLVAFGSCAVFGGPSGLGGLYGREALVLGVYGAGPTGVAGERPDDRAPRLETSVVPIDEVVTVDYALPGCPPSPYAIASGLRALLGGGAKMHSKPVCASCERKMRKRPGTPLQRGAVTADDPALCFLSQGVVCLGSVTLDRCQAPCPAVGVACTGCNGPSLAVLTEPQLDLRGMIAQRMHALTGVDPADVRGYLEQDARTYYAYALASPVIYRKPTVEIREWASGAVTGSKEATS